MSNRYVWAAAILAPLLVLGSRDARAAGIFADSVVSYSAGSISPSFSSYNVPSTATGSLQADVNAGQPFGFGALTPFNGTWQDTQMVGIGAGGSLTLHLGRTASKVGVHSGVGLIDVDYPNGQNLNPATPYTDPRQATLSVSGDGSTFFSLGSITFDIPSNYYDQGVTTPGNQTSAGTHVADFGQAFTGSLSTFNGLSWTQTLAALNGSGGGKWLDVTGVLPSGANYVRFDVASGQTMFVDSVATVAAVPEPVGAMVLILPVLAVLRRKCS